MKTMLIISFSHLKNDPRVFKQIDSFKEQFSITTAGYSSSEVFGVKHYDLVSASFTIITRFKYIFFLLTKRYEKAFRTIPKISKAFDTLKFEFSQPYDVVIGNDSFAWPLALSLQKVAKVILDAHEYAPKEFEDLLMWRLFFQKVNYYLCEKYLSLADSVLTVSENIALEYAKEFKIKKPIVIMNTPAFHPIKPSRPETNRVRMIHHGGTIRSRKLENMILLMNHLGDHFELYFMLTNNDLNYLAELKQMASETGRKIFFIEPVPMIKIVEHISKFDIGLYILEPISFNNKYALPNKIFEFIQARLAIAIGPSPEMEYLVKKYEIGWVAQSFAVIEMAQKLNTITFHSLTNAKLNTEKAAQEICFENELKKLQAIILN